MAVLAAGCTNRPAEAVLAATASPAPNATASAAAPPAPAPPAYRAAAGACGDAGFDLSAVTVVGRSRLEQPGGLSFGWSGITLSSRFSGTALRLDLQDSGRNQFSVAIDGAALPGKIIGYGGRYCYELASDLPPGEHLVTVTRLTEALLGPTTFHGFDGDEGASFSAPPQRSRRIEVIGDSITTAYGVEGEDRYCHFSADTQNHLLSYAALLAAGLDAQLWTEAWSGKGVASNRGSTTDTVPMPELWLRLLPQQDDSRWDFSRMVPDLVVIQLGTNDFAPENTDTQRFEPAYLALLRRVREAYPQATLVAALAPLLSDNWPPGKAARSHARDGIQGALAALSARGERRAHYFEHAAMTEAEGYGCDWHPGPRAHQRMADELRRFIKPLLGW